MSIKNKLALMSDDAFAAFYEIVLMDKKRREDESSSHMPEPSGDVKALLSKLDFFYAYKMYAEENSCTITLAKMAIDKWRKV